MDWTKCWHVILLARSRARRIRTGGFMIKYVVLNTLDDLHDYLVAYKVELGDFIEESASYPVLTSSIIYQFNANESPKFGLIDNTRIKSGLVDLLHTDEASVYAEIEKHMRTRFAVYSQQLKRDSDKLLALQPFFSDKSA